MKLTKTLEASLNSDQHILCARLLNRHEIIVLLSGGDVLKLKPATGTRAQLFSATNDSKATFKGLGFDIQAPCAMYALRDVVVVVNDRKTHGMAYNASTGRIIEFKREDYHADVSRYPIALYYSGADVPHLIYAVAWNQLQIMNLYTQRILTAHKTVTVAKEVDERFYQRHPDLGGRQDWPRAFDYFYGPLLFSPDGRRFLSRGWCWGSFEDYKIFELDHFIRHPHVDAHDVFGAEHMGRPMCWIDDHTLATTWYPYRDDNETTFSTHVHIYPDTRASAEPLTQFIIEGSAEVTGDLFYSRAQDVLVQIDSSYGTLVYRRDGQMLLTDKTFKPIDFYPDLGLFLSIIGDKITLHEMTA